LNTTTAIEQDGPEVINILLNVFESLSYICFNCLNFVFDYRYWQVAKEMERIVHGNSEVNKQYTKTFWAVLVVNVVVCIIRGFSFYEFLSVTEYNAEGRLVRIGDVDWKEFLDFIIYVSIYAC